MVEVKYLFGQPELRPGNYLSTALNGDISPPTATEIVVSYENYSHIVFKGDFVLDETGDVVGGSLSGFTLYAGSTKVVVGSGYAIDAAAFYDALQNNHVDWLPLDEMLFYSLPIKYIGSDQNDYLRGGVLNDKLLGRGGSDVINAGTGDDLLKGGKGADELYGGSGLDMLFGGKGHDVFRLAVQPDPGSSSKIKDFTLGKDLINLLFVPNDILEPGVLDAQHFHKGTQAADADDIVIYDKDSGRIYFDQDGSGGVYGQVEIGKVNAGTKLHAYDFIVDNGSFL